MDNRLAILMYHAIADQRECVDADARYAVSHRQFGRHLEMLRQAGLRGLSVAAMRSSASTDNAVALTFDDGHISNRKASEDLAACSFSADFFVNPAMVGRPNFLSWNDLRAMAAAGMSIQSHGQNHRYLDELTPQEVISELRDSKVEIEDQLGQAVTVFAPPGGRLSARLAETAAGVGYTALCTSNVGLWRLQDGPWKIPRLAVLGSTSEMRLARWIAKDWREMAGQHARHWVLSTSKRVLGNRGYENVRRRLLRSDHA